MDHHFLPQSPTSYEIRVPYVCADPEDGIYTPYVEGSFLTYPQRIHKDWLLSLGADDLNWTTDLLRWKYNFTSTKEQETIFQAWLFFGLLSAFLRSVYNARDYIEETDGGTFITTKVLIAKMAEGWQLRGAGASGEEKLQQFINAVRCLRLADRLLNSCREDFDWRIRISMISVIELFGRTINQAYADAKRDSGRIIAPVASPNFPSREIRREMLQAGWCPSEISTISSRFTTLQTLVFLSRLNKTDVTRNHEGCSDQQCRSYQIERTTYQTAHVTENCTCDPIPVDIKAIRTILYTNALPVLEISNFRLKSPSIKIVPSTEIPSFVALSHVWADGLGNSRNELPACQIAAVGKLVYDLQEKIAWESRDSATSDDKFQSQNRSDIAHVWIDTICCPSAPYEDKKHSLLRMRETYTNASQVLVLDKGLRTVDFKGTHPIASFLSVFNAAWVQRLWTLQEGFLPKQLWVQYRDEVVNLDKIYENLAATRFTDIRVMVMIEDVSHSWRALRHLQYANPIEPDNSLGTQLSNLGKALLNRTVSYASDEPLCVANLLGLDPDVLIDCPEDVESRMSTVWRSLAHASQGLPQRMIMLDYPRLTTPGFRWAPRTLLHAGIGNKIHALQWMDPVLGQVTERGFEVRYNAVSLELTPRTSGLAGPESAVSDVTLSIPIFFRAGGQPYLFMLNNDLDIARSSYTSIPKHASLFSKPLAVLQVYSIESKAGSAPCFTFVTRIDKYSADGSSEVEILCPALLSTEHEPFASLFAVVETAMERILAEGELPHFNSKEPGGQEYILKWVGVEVPLPPFMYRHVDTVLQERPELESELLVLYLTQSHDFLVKMLAFVVWASFAYTAKAELTEERVWCIR